MISITTTLSAICFHFCILKRFFYKAVFIAFNFINGFLGTKYLFQQTIYTCFRLSQIIIIYHKQKKEQKREKHLNLIQPMTVYVFIYLGFTVYNSRNFVRGQ